MALTGLILAGGIFMWMRKFPYPILPAVAVLIFFSCASNSSLFGKWQRIDDKGMIEFRQDGTFTGVDNMGANFQGNYTLTNGKIALEMTHSNILRESVTPEISPEIINAKISVCDDALQFMYIADDGKTFEIENYRRERPCP